MKKKVWDRESTTSDEQSQKHWLAEILWRWPGLHLCRRETITVGHHISSSQFRSYSSKAWSFLYQRSLAFPPVVQVENRQPFLVWSSTIKVLLKERPGSKGFQTYFWKCYVWIRAWVDNTRWDLKISQNCSWSHNDRVHFSWLHWRLDCLAFYPAEVTLFCELCFPEASPSNLQEFLQAGVGNPK